jgi:hypothetical protein
MHHARTDGGLGLLTTQLHFRHALPDRCHRWKVPSEKRRSTFLRRQGLPPQPLLSQDSMAGAIGRHALDGLHNRLDLDNIEVRIQVLDQATARCSSIGRL